MTGVSAGASDTAPVTEESAASVTSYSDNQGYLTRLLVQQEHAQGHGIVVIFVVGGINQG